MIDLSCSSFNSKKAKKKYCTLSSKILFYLKLTCRRNHVNHHSSWEYVYLLHLPKKTPTMIFFFNYVDSRKLEYCLWLCFWLINLTTMSILFFIFNWWKRDLKRYEYFSKLTRKHRFTWIMMFHFENQTFLTCVYPNIYNNTKKLLYTSKV